MPLTKRGDVWHWRKMVNGQILTRSTKTSDKRLAEQMAVKWEAEALRELVVEGTKPTTVHAALDAFLRARKGTGGYGNAKVHMAWWYKLPNVPLKTITLAQLQEICDQRLEAGASQNTLAVTVIYWNAMISFAKEHGWSVGPKLPNIKKVRTRMRFLSHEEEARLLDAINPKGMYPGKNPIKAKAKQTNADLVVCLLHTGARYSEIAHMTWDQVDFEHKTIYIKRKKGGNDTLLAMSEKLFSVLTRMKAEADSAYLFPGKLKFNTCYKWLDNALANAKISDEGGKVTIHCLRHTFASRMLKAGLSIVEVKELLGHKHLTSTAVYLHVQKSTVANRAAELLNAMA